MNLIVNTRYNDRRPTIFTSNYEDVPDTDDLDSLLVRVGFRMHSRLREMCEFLEYTGPDYRDFEYPPNFGRSGRAVEGAEESASTPASQACLGQGASAAQGDSADSSTSAGRVARPAARTLAAGSGLLAPGARMLYPEARSPKPEARSPKPEAMDAPLGIYLPHSVL